MRLGSLIRSEPFKAAVRVLCVFMVLFILASWTLIRSVEATLGDDLKAFIQVEAELLSQIYREEGREGLLSAIKEMGNQGHASDRVYGLFDERKLSLTGPMSTQPDFIGFDTRELSVLNGARIAGEYVLRVDQFDALTLVVGRNGDMIANARHRLLFGLTVFGGLLILCTLFLGIWAARRSQLRLDEMETALRDISAGQLDARLPVGVQNDQFDRVARRMNANLAQLERLVSSVKTTASAIAHDLKTPLSHAQIAMHQAAEAVVSNPEASDKVGAALAETDKLNSLFETVLRLSRIQTSKDRSMFRMASLKDIADTAIHFFEPVAEENSQTLMFNGEDVRIKMDPGMIQQAVINLVQNSCAHAGSGAVIEVIIDVAEDTVSLIVRDDGPGLPPEAIETALEPFVRGAPDRNAPGHGLGLAMVRAIADLHDAKLSLENTAQGFEVSLIFPIFKNS
ncbi:MAG: ATP-binding protein [Litoreibacter sp.]